MRSPQHLLAALLRLISPVSEVKATHTKSDAIGLPEREGANMSAIRRRATPMSGSRRPAAQEITECMVPLIFLFAYLFSAWLEVRRNSVLYWPGSSCAIQEGGEGVKTRGGRVLLGYGGSREGAGIVDVKSRTSLRRGESPCEAASGRASWKSKLWAKAVCAAWVRRANHRAMNAWAVAWRREVGAALLRHLDNSRTNSAASSLQRPPTSSATTTSLHLPPRWSSG